MTRLRQKYKKLKQMFERRPVKVIRQMLDHPIRVRFRYLLPDHEMELRKNFDFKTLVLETAAKEIAERLIKDKLITEYTEGVYGGTEYNYEVMVIPPFKPIKCEPMGECKYEPD